MPSIRRPLSEHTRSRSCSASSWNGQLRRCTQPRSSRNGSSLAIGGGDGDAHYAAAKGAVIGFIRSLAAEVAADGVRVNSVAPGPTDTPLLAADSPWRDPAYLATLPAGRLCTAGEIARAARFLIDGPGYCIGEVLSANSGAVI